LVLESDGLTASDVSFADDHSPDESMQEVDDDQDPVKQILFTAVGSKAPRPHLLALHISGRLNVYEALPRFTLDTASQSRRSLAVRFKKVYNQSLPIPATSKLPYTLIPFSKIEGQTGVFITGERPQWIMSTDAHPLKAYGLKQSAVAFARTTHLGGTGEYFIKIEDVSSVRVRKRIQADEKGSFICYLPPSLNTDFVMPCDRYEMPRKYTHVAFDPPSAHYVGASAITVPFQIYDEEGEILLGPEGRSTWSSYATETIC
jgi:cleavage and polyadenylation specificity factor subunit 1